VLIVDIAGTERRGFMILARSVCEIMAKKSKLGHFSTPEKSQRKSHMAPIFGPVRSLDQGVLPHKATGC
jgi:hypothetical protein